MGAIGTSTIFVPFRRVYCYKEQDSGLVRAAYYSKVCTVRTSTDAYCSKVCIITKVQVQTLDCYGKCMIRTSTKSVLVQKEEPV